MASPAVYGTLGTPAAGNIPGGRDGAVELDRQQRQSLALWGLWRPMPTATAGYLNDLWEFNPSTNNGPGWAEAARSAVWQASPASTARWERLLPETSPEAVLDAASWTDSSGNFWLFGGSRLSMPTAMLGYLNDLWEFNPSLGS